MGDPLVSVVMNCFNGARYLREALSSVFSQTYSNWEIVFWDNASTDDSGNIAKSYGQKVRYFASEKTTSVGVARNKAFERCQGEYIAILDVDDIWFPEKLSRQIPLLETNPDVGMVFSNSILFKNEKDQYDLFKCASPKRGKVFGNLLSENFISTETMIYRKECLEKFPYIFDEEFSMAQDYDLSLRVAYFHELDYINDPLSKWRMHPNSLSNKKRFRFPHENKALIDRLCNYLPNIKIEFEDQLNNFIKLVNTQLAFEQWNYGNTFKARELLSLYLKYPKCFVPYLCTYIISFNTYDNLKSPIIAMLRRMLRV